MEKLTQSERFARKAPAGRIISRVYFADASNATRFARTVRRLGGEARQRNHNVYGLWSNDQVVFVASIIGAMPRVMSA